MEEKDLIKQIDISIKTKEFDSIADIILNNLKLVEKSNTLATIYYLMPVYIQEKKQNIKTIFDKVENTEELILRYTKLKFFLRRIDFDLLGDELDTFMNFLVSENVSPFELMKVVEQSIVHKDKVLSFLHRL